MAAMPIPSTTTNLPNGVTNVLDATQTTLGSYVAPDPTRVHEWFTDFDDYDANQWVITSVGGGTRSVGNADGGIFTLTNTGSDNDNNFLQWSGVTSSTTSETFTWEATQAMWFKARFKVSDATQTDIIMGLQTTDTTPLDASDGLFFQKDDGSTTLYFQAVKSSTATTLTPIGTLADNTYCTCGFWWDPVLGVLTCYFNGNPAASTTTTTNFPTVTLTVSFGVQNGDGTIRTMATDYILAAKDRHTNLA